MADGISEPRAPARVLPSDGYGVPARQSVVHSDAPDDWVLASEEESDILYEIRAKVRKYREPLIKNAVESTDTHGIMAQGGRRRSNPSPNELICTKTGVAATSSGGSAITIRFSPTQSSP